MEHRHLNTAHVHRQLRLAQNPARLQHQFQLFAGVAVILTAAGHRQHIKGVLGLRPFAGLQAVQQPRALARQALHADPSGRRRTLHLRHRDPGQIAQRHQRFQRQQQLHRGGVGGGHDVAFAGGAELFVVDPGDQQRHVGLIAERRRQIQHQRAGVGGARCQFLGHRRAGGEHRQLHP